MTISKRLENILARLPEIANDAILNFKHAAMLIRNGKVLSCGINSVNGLKTKHAEINAIEKYFNIHNLKLSLKWQYLLC